jgi:predicted nucleotidyltransferase
MYTIRPDKPVNPVIREILVSVQTLARQLGYSYLLIGASARDMLMSHVFGIESRRATHDVDFAVAIEDWDSFHLLRNALLESGDFAPAESTAHLLYYRPGAHGKAYPLDLIPFGGLEQEVHRIAWPPDMAVVMNVTGYAEALASALEVDVGNSLVIPVVSIPALAVLKLLAWNDRGLQDNKDAQDLSFLLQHYHEAGNHDRLYDDAYTLLENCGFDLVAAGATLLGYDAGIGLNEDSREALFTVLADVRKRDRLLIHMTRATAMDAGTAATLLTQFERGLRMKAL